MGQAPFVVAFHKQVFLASVASGKNGNEQETVKLVRAQPHFLWRMPNKKG
jgi:hypothetical protein